MLYRTNFNSNFDLYLFFVNNFPSSMVINYMELKGNIYPIIKFLVNYDKII